MRTASLFTLAALAGLCTTAFAAPSAPIVGYWGRSKTAALIYSAPSAKAHALYRVAANCDMVVNAAGPKWLSVVMRQGRLGYVPVQSVALHTDASNRLIGFTEAQIRSFASPAGRAGMGYVASRGGGFVRGTASDRDAMAEYALKWEGSTPYKWGGTELGSGIDCSGFVKKMYGAIGLNLPRTAAEQAQVGVPIYRLEELRPGDRLYFYEAKRGKIGHTGIYVGNGYFVHSSSGHNGIAHDYLSERWQRILVAARR